MKTRAFTLIELLVVVLIIGILAAIAVPQYHKAVMKSQAVEAILNLKTLRNAQRIYYLANGKYTTNLTELDLNFPQNIYRYTCIRTEFIDCYAYRVDNQYPYFEIATNSSLLCRGSAKDCESFSNKRWDTSSSVPYWIIEE